jgi:hypothetical protein
MDKRDLIVVTTEGYADLKSGIRKNLDNATEAFVEIGYCLRQINAGKLYEEDGYENIWDFAMGEYNLSQSTASRFMSINARFSIEDGTRLAERYIGMGSSKLQEMLGLDDEDLEKVTRDTTVKEIRAMKTAKKTKKSKAKPKAAKKSPRPRAEAPEPGYNIDEVARLKAELIGELETYERMGIADDRYRKRRMLLDAVAVLEKRMTKVKAG